MVFNATINNISVTLWQSVLLVEETGVCEDNHLAVASHSQPLSHKVVSSDNTMTGVPVENHKPAASH
jgi:hypothetical protein